MLLNASKSFVVYGECHYFKTSQISLAKYWLFKAGDLKLMVTQSIGLDPETHKLLFRGKEKEDNEHLQLAGVKDMSKMLLMEDTTCKEERPVEVAQTSVVSRGGAAVAEIRKDIDELSEQVDFFSSFFYF